MKLLNILIHNSFVQRGFAQQNRAFTLIEILVVIGLFALIASIGMSFSQDSYRAYLFRSEYGIFNQLLSKARNHAASNFDQSAHGVHIENDSYTLFVGDAYSVSDPDNIVIPRSSSVSVSGATDVVFEQLSGNLKTCDATPCEIVFSYGGRGASTKINEVGGITW